MIGPMDRGMANMRVALVLLALVGLYSGAATASEGFTYALDASSPLVYQVSVHERITEGSAVPVESKLGLEYTVRTRSADTSTGTAFRTVTALCRTMEQSILGKPIEGDALARVLQDCNAGLANDPCALLQTDRGHMVLRSEKSALVKGIRDALFAFPVPAIDLRNRTQWTVNTNPDSTIQKHSTSLQDVSVLDCMVVAADDAQIRIAFRGRSEYAKWHHTREDPVPVTAPGRAFDLLVTGQVVLDRAKACVESAVWEEVSVSWEREGPVTSTYGHRSWRLMVSPREGAGEDGKP
jgi:hypothetical protein